METESEGYRKIITLLRASKPELSSAEKLESEIMQRIAGKSRAVVAADSFISFLFGWTYIGWVRRSLITVSIILVAFFIWQQSLIVRQINVLNSRLLISEIENVKYQPRVDGKKLLMMGKSGSGFSDGEIEFSEDKIEKLLESYATLKSDYGELLKLINEDPELKKLIEEKADQNRIKKFKL